MKKYVIMMALISAVLTCMALKTMAHCQVPCGIYGDSTRFELMREHVTTIEKSMTEIVRLEKEKTPNNNQLVRWVQNKEVHADELAEIVTYYFMAQRVKPASGEDKAKYVEQLTLLHEILVQSMKAKQTTDKDCCAKLNKLIAKFEKAYTDK